MDFARTNPALESTAPLASVLMVNAHLIPVRE